ncbi:MAG: 8-amino-7-oxononanoate synthase [Alphaproteobacteria bacterium]|nr:8-amino-7-oxononanoate synthase [Alphaproteobacteria bacterium]
MSALGPRLDALDAQGLRRRLRPVDGADLSGNDALGLSRDPLVREALQTALSEGWPHGSTGSRLLSGDHPAWSALEARVAAWQGTEAALYFSTGYAANVGLLSALPQAGDRVISDALNHASLIDGMRLGRADRVVVPHRDVDAVARVLAQSRGRRCWVAVESLYSMDGDLTPLMALAEVCAAYSAHLLVDEAHATGLYGPEGQGRVAAEGLRGPASPVFASIHTCGKALGLSGAFVCGPRALRDWLINQARSFVFSTATPPFLAAGLEAALARVRRDPALRARPAALGQRLRDALAGRVDTGASQSHIVPLLVGSPEAALALEARLATRGWHARAIRPPTVPPGSCRVRVVLRADLSDAQVDRLAADILESLG